MVRLKSVVLAKIHLVGICILQGGIYNAQHILSRRLPILLNIIYIIHRKIVSGYIPRNIAVLHLKFCLYCLYTVYIHIYTLFLTNKKLPGQYKQITTMHQHFSFFFLN